MWLECFHLGILKATNGDKFTFFLWSWVCASYNCKWEYLCLYFPSITILVGNIKSHGSVNTIFNFLYEMINQKPDVDRHCALFVQFQSTKTSLGDIKQGLCNIYFVVIAASQIKYSILHSEQRWFAEKLFNHIMNDICS